MYLPWEYLSVRLGQARRDCVREAECAVMGPCAPTEGKRHEALCVLRRLACIAGQIALAASVSWVL